ncbi:LYR motif-containing protein 4 isoform X1 [Accipiter gentilis]|uniref:LYR motif-containing protein 4 isoform X1 n=1 Tax=Astur gentilis TaxID=8957 RepID=UPI00210F2743|nr:LYR motif-containing protein 4 isoform X1 [Accipiter gentilis]
MAASSRAEVLRLYRALLRESQRFGGYNYRRKEQERDCPSLKKLVSVLDAALLLLAGESRGRVVPWLCRRRLASLPNPDTMCCGQAEGAACDEGAEFTRPDAQGALLLGWLPLLAVGERHAPFFGRWYICLRAIGIGQVSVRYPLCLQGVLPTNTSKIVLLNGSLFTLPLSWTTGRDM